MRNGDGRGCWLCDLLVGGVRELSLFSGAGGGLLGTKLLGFRHVGYVEWNEYCQQVIAARIRDGNLDGAPIFGDIDTFISEGYADAYKGMVDVVSGGFPCQPYSSAGKQLGENDPKDRWPATREVIRRVHQSSACWKTSLGLFPSDTSEKFSGTWPKWGSMRNGELFHQPQPVQTMFARGSGYLPTPTAHNSKEGAYPAEYTRNTPTLAAVLGGKIAPPRTEWMMGWPIGWSDLKPLETDSLLLWQRAHGKY